jgi:tRNA G18 (ribose-2'-O)-methylase SpoU
MFRTCDAAGIREIYLAGYSPCPTDRFDRKRKDIAKTALGAEDTIAWKYFKNPVLGLQKLKKEGFHVVAVEQAANSIDYKKVKLPKSANILFVVGNEVEGLSKKLLALADQVAEIPMRGGKESLNVSVSAGIAIFRILNI